MEVERREKTLEWVKRGVESEYDDGVGMTLEVRLNRYKKKLKWR